MDITLFFSFLKRFVGKDLHINKEKVLSAKNEDIIRLFYKFDTAYDSAKQTTTLLDKFIKLQKHRELAKIKLAVIKTLNKEIKDIEQLKSTIAGCLMGNTYKHSYIATVKAAIAEDALDNKNPLPLLRKRIKDLASVAEIDIIISEFPDSLDSKNLQAFFDDMANFEQKLQQKRTSLAIKVKKEKQDKSKHSYRIDENMTLDKKVLIESIESWLDAFNNKLSPLKKYLVDANDNCFKDNSIEEVLIVAEFCSAVVKDIEQDKCLSAEEKQGWLVYFFAQKYTAVKFQSVFYTMMLLETKAELPLGRRAIYAVHFFEFYEYVFSYLQTIVVRSPEFNVALRAFSKTSLADLEQSNSILPEYIYTLSLFCQRLAKENPFKAGKLFAYAKKEDAKLHKLSQQIFDDKLKFQDEQVEKVIKYLQKEFDTDLLDEDIKKVAVNTRNVATDYGKINNELSTKLTLNYEPLEFRREGIEYADDSSETVKKDFVDRLDKLIVDSKKIYGKKLTQKQIAEFCGISAQVVTNWLDESVRDTIAGEHLQIMALLFNVSYGYLTGLTIEPDDFEKDPGFKSVKQIYANHRYNHFPETKRNIIELLDRSFLEPEYLEKIEKYIEKVVKENKRDRNKKQSKSK